MVLAGRSNSSVLSQDVKMHWQVGGTSNDAGLCCKAFKPATLQAILILAARQWGFLLGGQPVHQGIWESEDRHHTVAIYLYKKLRSQQEALSEASICREHPRTNPKLKYLNPDWSSL